MTAGIAFDNSPPPIAMEPLLAFPIRDPAFAGAAGPAPGLNQSPYYHVGGYRSLIFNFDGVQNPAPGSPVTFTFIQGWPGDALPGSAGGPGTVKPVWQHTALIPPIGFRYWMACRIPVVAPLFTYVLGSFVASTSGTQQVTSLTIHGTQQACSEVQPLDTPVVATILGGQLVNRKFFQLAANAVIPGGGSVDIGLAGRRWYVGRAYLSWFTDQAPGLTTLALTQQGGAAAVTQYVLGRAAALTWQVDEVEIPSDLFEIRVLGPAGANIYGGVGVGTQPIP